MNVVAMPIDSGLLLMVLIFGVAFILGRASK